MRLDIWLLVRHLLGARSLRWP